MKYHPDRNLDCKTVDCAEKMAEINGAYVAIKGMEDENRGILDDWQLLGDQFIRWSEEGERKDSKKKKKKKKKSEDGKEWWREYAGYFTDEL